ncbi:MAG: hypothetical protein HYX69_13700 [Planctomycetia bacterium]|nr:hypothetical protein [Planctomycetia bacterium]
MWCTNCRQDVPAVSNGADEKKCCIRCGAVMVEGATAAGPNIALPEPHGAGGQLSTFAIRAPLSSFDTWELEEQLRHVDRILSGARFTTELKPHISGERRASGDADSHGGTAAGKTPARPSRVRVKLAWTIVTAGAAALGCGIVLLCAGAIAGRPGWQSFGLPITLLGQVALLFGMMMQLDLVWHGKRETASKLYRFQKRLVDLEALAEEIGDTAAAEPSEEEPNDREMMAELKTRLDILSHRLNVPCG